MSAPRSQELPLNRREARERASGGVRPHEDDSIKVHGKFGSLFVSSQLAVTIPAAAGRAHLETSGFVLPPHKPYLGKERLPSGGNAKRYLPRQGVELARR